MSYIINPKIDIPTLCKGWKYDSANNEYTIIDSFGEEYVTINATTREFHHYGYIEMLNEWAREEIIVNDAIDFPHTIGNITYRSRQELEEWVIKAQEKYNNI